MTIGKPLTNAQLRGFIKQAGTQQRLADALEVNVRTIRRWLSGRSTIPKPYSTEYVECLIGAKYGPR
jgi:DNA-binding transcriptional regulator YiaG